MSVTAGEPGCSSRGTRLLKGSRLSRGRCPCPGPPLGDGCERGHLLARDQDDRPGQAARQGSCGMLEICVVRLITKRRPACPIRAGWGGKRRVLTVTDAVRAAPATCMSAGLQDPVAAF